MLLTFLLEFLVEMGFHFVAQVGLKDSPASDTYPLELWPLSTMSPILFSFHFLITTIPLSYNSKNSDSDMYIHNIVHIMYL